MSVFLNTDGHEERQSELELKIEAGCGKHVLVAGALFLLLGRFRRLSLRLDFAI